MKTLALVVVASIGCARAGGAQSIGDRIARVEGRAQIVFPSREQVCGDGLTRIGHLLRSDRDEWIGTFNGRDDVHACVHGPGRLVITVSHGQVTFIHAFVGPVPPLEHDVTDLGTVSAADARAWLADVARRGDATAAKKAILPLLLPDAPLPWPELLAVARDEGRPREVRREATFWLAQGASALVDPDGDGSDADDVKKSAVFALSQQPKDVAVPILVQLASDRLTAPVRASALFWLGQTGDERGLPVFARVLGIQ
jgi:PBS lyase HEAT-like repeat